MSLPYALQTRWSATSALTSLIPATRVFTGRAPKQANGTPQPIPYCNLNLPRSSPRWTTNAALRRETPVEFEFWCATRAQGDQIVKAIEDAYENWSTTLSGGYGFLRELAPGPVSAIEEDDPQEGKIWHYTFEFTAYIDRVRRAS